MALQPRGCGNSERDGALASRPSREPEQIPKLGKRGSNELANAALAALRLPPPLPDRSFTSQRKRNHSVWRGDNVTERNRIARVPFWWPAMGLGGGRSQTQRTPVRQAKCMWDTLDRSSVLGAEKKARARAATC